MITAPNPALCHNLTDQDSSSSSAFASIRSEVSNLVEHTAERVVLRHHSPASLDEISTAEIAEILPVLTTNELFAGESQ